MPIGRGHPHDGDELIELRENMSDELSNFSAGGDADDRLSESTINRRLAQGVRLALAARLEWLDHILSSAGEAGSPNSRGKKR